MWRKLSIVNNVCRETGCFREKSLTRCLSKVFHFVRLRKHFACSVYEGSAHNLGVFLDKQLSVSHHIANLRRNTHTKKKIGLFPSRCLFSPSSSHDRTTDGPRTLRRIHHERDVLPHHVPSSGSIKLLHQN